MPVHLDKFSLFCGVGNEYLRMSDIMYQCLPWTQHVSKVLPSLTEPHRFSRCRFFPVRLFHVASESVTAKERNGVLDVFVQQTTVQCQRSHRRTPVIPPSGSNPTPTTLFLKRFLYLHHTFGNVFFGGVFLMHFFLL